MLNFRLISLGAAIGLTLSGTYAVARPPAPAVYVLGHKIDPETQRIVSYADLNLAMVPEQKTLKRRIGRTAESLCLDLNGSEGLTSCTADAVHSTDDQVAEAIGRAQRQMAGLAVGPAVAISMVIGTK